MLTDSDWRVFTDSEWRHANLCEDAWPKERLTFSLPFDDATEMSEALTLLLHALRTEQKPTDDADLVDRLHWSGEKALQQVLSATQWLAPRFAGKR